MTSDAYVVDVTQDWAIACDVQQRFTQNPGPTIDTSQLQRPLLSAACIGGRLLPLCAAAAESSRTSHRGCLRKGSCCGLDDRQRAILAPHRGFIRPKRCSRRCRRSESPGSFVLARRSVRHIILRRIRRSHTDAALRQRGPQFSDGYSQGRVGRATRTQRPACRSLCRLHLPGKRSRAQSAAIWSSPTQMA